MPLFTFSRKCRSEARLDGKTAIVTGCNSGIGKETVRDFYKRGARIIMACRNLEKAEQAKKDIVKSCSELQNVGEIAIVRLDLSSLTSVRECAHYLLKTEPKINLLVNNAGVMCSQGKTEDGFEIQFGTNHLSPFLFTLLLFPRIRTSKPARIVNVASIAHTTGEMCFEDLHFEKRKFTLVESYSQSKLANILFSKQLAKIIEDAKITDVNVYSLHPGIIDTDFIRHVDSSFIPVIQFVYKWTLGWFIKSPEQGAQTTIYCALDEKCAQETGLYYSECQVTLPSKAAQNEKSAETLWEVSQKLVRIENWNPLAEDAGIESHLLKNENL